MPRATFISLMPARSYMEATPTSIGDGGFSANGDGHSVDVRLFLPMNKQQAHLIFNRVAAWNFTFRFKIKCPNPGTLNEYQVVEGGGVWDRRDVIAYETDLHPLDPVAGSPDPDTGDWVPGYDFAAFYPPPVRSGICIATGYDDSSADPIYTRDGTLAAYFMGFAYIDDWTQGEAWGDVPCGGVQFEIHVEGSSFDTPNDLDGGSFLPPIAANCILSGFPNSAQFDGADTTDFRIKGVFQGGVAGGSYPSTAVELYMDDTVMLSMTPTAWYPYEKDGVPKFDATDGHPL